MKLLLNPSSQSKKTMHQANLPKEGLPAKNPRLGNEGLYSERQKRDQ